MPGVKGRGGRPRKSVVAHKRDGTYRPGQHGKPPGEHDLDGLDGSVPKRPARLANNSHAKTMWDHLSARIGGSGIMSDIDGYQLEQLCRMWSMWQRIMKKCETETDDEELAKLERRAIQCSVAFDRVASKFGLTPADRAKLRAAPREGGNDDLSEFGIVG